MKLLAHNAKHDCLKEVPLFKNLSKRNLDHIAHISDEMRIEAGTVLANQGEVGLEFAFVLEGEAMVEKDGKVVNHLCSNEYFGEIALIDGKRRSATVIAETDMRLLVIDTYHFKELLETVPGLMNVIIINLCKYLREAERKSLSDPR